MNEPKKPPKTHEKLIGLRLVNSTSFAGETESLTIGRNVDSIIPARMETDCRAVAIDKSQRADGFLVRRLVPAVSGREPHVAQTFICFANIREVQFGE